MAISPTSSVRPVTISDDGVRAVLAGTHLASVADQVIQYAQQYNIDPNFFLGYVKYENGFMDAYTGNVSGFVGMNNPFDIVCVNAYGCNYGNCPGSYTDPCGDPSGNNSASDCRNPGNGWCYAVYPSLEAGVQAALWQTNYWITNDGITDSWQSLLGVAGFGPGNVTEIVNQCNAWAAQYPPSPGGPPPPPDQCPPGYSYDPSTGGCVYDAPPIIETTQGQTLAIIGGLAILGGGAYFALRHALK